MSYSILFTSTFAVALLLLCVSSSSFTLAEDPTRQFLYQDLEEQVKQLQYGVEQLHTSPSQVLRKSLIERANYTNKLIMTDLNEKVYFNKDDAEYARVMNKVGNLLVKVGAEVDGVIMMRDAMEMRKRIAESKADEADEIDDDINVKKLRRDPSLNNLVLDEDVAESFHDYGLALDLVGRRDEALLFLENALKMRRKMFGNELSNKEGNRQIAQSLTTLGNAVNKRGQYDIGTNYLAEALDIHKELNALPDGSTDVDHPDVAEAHTHIGHAFSNGGSFDDALRHHKKALDMHEKINEVKKETDSFNENLHEIAKIHSDVAGVMAAMPEKYSISDFLNHLIASVDKKRYYLQEVRKNLKDQKFADQLVYVGRTLLEISKQKSKVHDDRERKNLQMKGKEMIKEAWQVYTLLGKPAPPEVMEYGEMFFEESFEDF